MTPPTPQREVIELLKAHYAKTYQIIQAPGAANFEVSEVNLSEVVWIGYHRGRLIACPDFNHSDEDYYINLEDPEFLQKLDAYVAELIGIYRRWRNEGQIRQ